MTPIQQLYLNELNPEQARAVLAPRHHGVKVLAGAGTGKTKLIAHRFVKLVDEMVQEGIERPQDRILAVSFTVKAAEEMEERIHQQLHQLGYEGLSPQAWISNFHGFCQRLLRQHASDLDLVPDFAILDTLQQRLIFNRLISGIKAGDFQDISPTLTRFALDQVIAPTCLSLESLMVLPVESVSNLMKRLPKLINKIKASGLTPAEFRITARSQSLGLTERLKTLTVCNLYTGGPYESHQSYCQVWDKDFQLWKEHQWSFLGTDSHQERFHQKAWEKATREGKTYDHQDNEAYYLDRVKWLYDIKIQGQNLYVDFTKKTNKKRPEPFLPGCQHFSELDAVTEKELQMIDLITAIYALYQDTLQTSHSCDFDDLINRSIELLSRNEYLRAHYQQQFEAIIVDEFQDSNGSQLKLLQLLTRENSANITVVGDMKQSIYGFRFAQPENMDLIFGSHPYDSISLKTNYRSVAPILAVANCLTEAITHDTDQQLTVEKKQSGDQVASPDVQWITLGGSEEEKEPIGNLKEREARWVAIEIARLLQASNENNSLGEERLLLRDIAILVKNHRKAEILQKALRELGIPVIRQKNQGFFQETVIKDTLALLRLMLNLHDNTSLVRILQGKLNQRQVRLIASQARTLKMSIYSLLEKLSEESTYCPELSPPVRSALISLVEELKAVKQRQSYLNPVQLFFRLSETIGLISPHWSADEQQEAQISLRTFKNLLYQICSDNLQPTLDEVLTTIEYYQEDPNLELPVAEKNGLEDAVQIMTIHAAKGLERRIVFVAYTETDGSGNQEDAQLLFDPQYEGKAGFGFMLGKDDYDADTLKKQVYQTIWRKPREENERKRLFYVALTRAQERLYVLRAKQSPYWTDSTHFENPQLLVLNEAEQNELFQERYWGVDVDILKSQVKTLLNSSIKTSQLTP